MYVFVNDFMIQNKFCVIKDEAVHCGAIIKMSCNRQAQNVHFLFLLTDGLQAEITVPCASCTTNRVRIVVFNKSFAKVRFMTFK